MADRLGAPRQIFLLVHCHLSKAAATRGFGTVCALDTESFLGIVAKLVDGACAVCERMNERRAVIT